MLPSAPIGPGLALCDEIALVNEVEIRGQHQERNMPRVNDGVKILTLCQSKQAWSHGIQAGVLAVLALSL